MDRPADGGQQARRPTAVRTSSKALSRQRRPPRWHHGQRRELPCVPVLLPCAALRQPSKSAALAASDSLLPRMGCSLRSGCAMDESHSASTHSSTLRAGGRAGKLTQVSELCRCPARRSRSRLRPRAQLAIIRLFGDAAARAPTCGTYPARTPHRIPARIETLQRPHRARCSVASLQL